MGLFSSQSKVDRVIESVESHPVLKSAARTAVESAFAAGMAARKDSGASHSRPTSSPILKAGKPALLVAAGVAGLAAASAAVSSLRERQAA